MKFIPIAEPVFFGNEKKYLLEAIDSGWVSSQGPLVKKFESGFRKWLKVKNATSCSSGTAALHLALLSLGIGKGDEVIVPDSTFVAVGNMVKETGAEPVFVDIRKDTWNIDETKISGKISKRTKAIIAVHSFGCPCEMKTIQEIAEKHSLRIIEDCAEAHGSKYGGKMAGSIGDVSAFSFFGNKILTTGEGGMVCSNDDEIIDAVQLLKNHGMRKERPLWHERLAYNYRLTNLQAAIGLGQLENADKLIEMRGKNHAIYKKGLSGIDGVFFQEIPKNCGNVEWLTTVVLDGFMQKRDFVINKMKTAGIDCRRTHYAMTELPMYRDKHDPKEYKNSVWFSGNGISLPSSPSLSEDEIVFIVENFLKK